MNSKIIELYCPKCNEQTAETPADLNTNKPFTCKKCGAVIAWSELKTSSGAKLKDHLANKLRNAFKGVKGFKPGR